MKVYAISVVKNEDDIIENAIKSACKWADKVILYDNGSTDKTWEIINDYADSVIIPFKSDTKPYSDSLRNEIYNSFKHELSDTDWWAIQDADELYMENPREFVKSVDRYSHVVNSRKINFYIPKEELINKEQEISSNFNLDNYKLCDNWAWSEIRLFRNRKKLAWKNNNNWPKFIGVSHPNQINISHFPLRTIAQIKKKFEEKKEINKLNSLMFAHIRNIANWYDLIPNSDELLKIDGNFHEVFKNVSIKNNLNSQGLKGRIKWYLHRLGLLP